VFDQNCSACHQFSGEQRLAPAPLLSGIIGRQVAAQKFSYSKAMKAADFIWTKERLFQFLKNPSKYLPGTKMLIGDLEDPAERADLIAYLETK